ncbi:hypothetical protein FACS1894164_06920 [Spirochaetia bacterium]|nr:hypothetical protein FACS1894164_06920 [Spirochaetia bacterium]
MEQYIQPFIDVCVSVFKEFVGCEIKAERPYFIKHPDANNWGISAVIGFTGEARGAVVISLKKDLAIRLTDMLTDHHHTTLDDEVTDAIGEIVNIIAGNVKRNLEEEFRLVISLPTIIHGDNHVIGWQTTQTRAICIPFKIFNDSFCLYIALEAQ